MHSIFFVVKVSSSEGEIQFFNIFFRVSVCKYSKRLENKG